MATSLPGELEHRYGPRVHLVGDPWLHALLARAGSPTVDLPALLDVVRAAYRLLLARAAARELPTSVQAIPTRMRERTEQGIWRGEAIDPGSPVVVANVLRAGNVPSLTCFEELTRLLAPGAVRMDHFYLFRQADVTGRVVGTSPVGHRIGGPIEGRTIVLADPMGATGTTTITTRATYAELVGGQPSKVLALHLIVTPEYVRRVLGETDDVIVYAGRLDRGTSPPEILATVPGTHPDQERGLDEHDYIVPGAGGLGEALTNAWV